LTNTYFLMDILYTVEEKYLQAVEELNYGELPKALMSTVCPTEHSALQDHLKRIKDKQNLDRNVIYTYQE